MSGLIKAACRSNITQLQINKVKVTWYPTNDTLVTNKLIVNSFRFSKHTRAGHFKPQSTPARARHQSKSSVDSRSLSPYPPQLFARSSTSETSVFTYSYHILPLRKSLSRLSSVN